MRLTYKISIFQMNSLDKACIYKTIKIPFKNLKKFIKATYDPELNISLPYILLRSNTIPCLQMCTQV